MSTRDHLPNGIESFRVLASIQLRLQLHSASTANISTDWKRARELEQLINQTEHRKFENKPFQVESATPWVALASIIIALLAIALSIYNFVLTRRLRTPSEPIIRFRHQSASNNKEPSIPVHMPLRLSPTIEIRETEPSEFCPVSLTGAETSESPKLQSERPTESLREE